MKTKEFIWRTHLQNEVSLKGCSDEHLANTIQYLNKYDYPLALQRSFSKEAKVRRLTEEFINKAQFPYKDGIGNWIIWCFKENRPKIIGRYKRG